MTISDDPVARLRAELVRRDRLRTVAQAIALLSLAFAVGFLGTAWWAL